MRPQQECQSWFGHKFVPRYDEVGQQLPSLPTVDGSYFSTITTTFESEYKRIYRGDVCVRCGEFVPAPAESHKEDC